MARGIEIPLSINPAKVIRGLKITDDAFEDLQDTIEDVSEAAEDAFDLDPTGVRRDLGRIEDAADDVKDELKDVGDEAKDAESAFGRLGRGARSDLGKVERAAKDAEDEVGDIEEEANASAKEFGAAFRGDPVEALEEVQSYLAEIVSVKLPGFAGAAATIAGGAVLGLVVAGVEKWREKQERINEIATDYLGIIQEAVDGPLSATSRAYDDLIDKQIVLAVLEEASADQLSNLAVLAAARGETVEQYVTKVLKGEIRTQDELARIEQERANIADLILEYSTDNIAANDAQIPILQAQDRALQEQGEAVRAVGSFINENKAGYDKAKAAQDNLGRSTDASKEKQRALNRAAADMRNPIVKNIDSVEDLDDAIDDAADPRRVTITVGDGGSLARFNAAMAAAVKPAYKTVFVTETRRDAAAASRAQTGQQP